MHGKRMISGLTALALMTGLWGCAKSEDAEFKTQEKGVAVKESEHHHHHEPGPHGGIVADLENHQYRLEITYAKDPRAITVYVLEHENDNLAALDAQVITLELEGEGDPAPVSLAADPQEKDPEGKASRFKVTGAAIPESIQDVEDIHGHLVVTIDGKPLEAEISHDHEGHHEH